MTDKNSSPDHIDSSNAAQLDALSQKLDATPQQIQEAIEAVGNKASDIEMHLKGTRSTTNADEVRKVAGSGAQQE